MPSTQPKLLRLVNLVGVERRRAIAGSLKIVEDNGRLIGVFHTNGKFCRVENSCVHQDGTLDDGDFFGTGVVFPWHGCECVLQTGVITLIGQGSLHASRFNSMATKS
jgi:nitrite reductase/ring-hydroxylating ferredoxin subunit